MKIKLVVLSLLIGAGGTFGVETAAQAGCNFYGCPLLTQQPTTQQPKRIEQQRVNPKDIATCVNEIMWNRQSTGISEKGAIQACRNGMQGLNPADIATCVNEIMWNRQSTGISEQGAVQACRGGR